MSNTDPIAMAALGRDRMASLRAEYREHGLTYSVAAQRLVDLLGWDAARSLITTGDLPLPEAHAAPPPPPPPPPPTCETCGQLLPGATTTAAVATTSPTTTPPGFVYPPIGGAADPAIVERIRAHGANLVWEAKRKFVLAFADAYERGTEPLLLTDCASNLSGDNGIKTLSRLSDFCKGDARAMRMLHYVNVADKIGAKLPG